MEDFTFVFQKLLNINRKYLKYIYIKPNYDIVLLNENINSLKAWSDLST